MGSFDKFKKSIAAPEVEWPDAVSACAKGKVTQVAGNKHALSFAGPGEVETGADLLIVSK